MPDEHVEHRQHQQLAPVFARNAKRHPHGQQRQPQHRRAQPEAHHAESERRKAGDPGLHDRPVDAPDEGQQDQDDPLAGGKLVHWGDLRGLRQQMQHLRVTPAFLLPMF